MKILIKLSIAFCIAASGFVIGPLLKKWIIRLSRSINDVGALTFLGSCVSTLTKVIAIVIALSHLGVDTNVIVGAFSAVGLGISLALKDSMANVAGGIQILFTRPFIVDDYIQIDQKEGTVKRIEMMFTVLETPSAQEIVVPNAVLVQNVLVNYSRQPDRRIFFTFPVSIYADFHKIQEMCMQLIQDDERICKEKTIDVTVESMQERSMLIGIYCWVSYDQYWDVLHDLNQQVQKKRLEESIEVSYESVQMRSNSLKA